MGAQWPRRSRAAGQSADALKHHAAALAAANRTGVQDQRARAHAGLGHAYRDLGDLGVQMDTIRAHWPSAPNSASSNS